MREEHNKMH
jgi:hypothetical protein